MPYRVSQKELDAILWIVAQYTDGASVGDLMQTPELDLPRRTLQRRIDRLIDQNCLVPVGEGRARRYVVARQSERAAETETRYYPGSDDDWLSPEAKEIRDNVTRPVTARTPVGYNVGFLDSYVPNETAYLPVALRRHLSKIGQVSLSDLPAGTHLRKVLDRLLIDLSWNSSRLEGNTYSLLETQRLLEMGEAAEGRQAEETQMILNHKAAIEMLAEQSVEIGFNRYTILNLHALLADNLLADLTAVGRVRQRPVGISGTVFHPLEVPQMIDEQFDRILEKASAIENAFEQSFFVMVHLPYLQPFEDVNKRVSRLAANISLVKHNLCPLSFIEVSQEDYVMGLLGVYELNRVEYLRDMFAWAYERSCVRYGAVRQSLGDPDPFRLRYRTQIGSFVQEIVQSKMDKAAAAKWIAAQTEPQIPANDRAQFIEVVETEVMNLHVGSIARYRLRPQEFDEWQEVWR